MAEPMVEVFIYETRQFLEQLEQISLASEENGGFSVDDVNEIFRAMHTIKGSAAMMMFDEVSTLAHSVVIYSTTSESCIRKRWMQLLLRILC